MIFDVQSFLKQGVILSHDANSFLVGWGQMEWSRSPFEGAKAFYLPDFFLEMDEPWLHCEFTAIIPRDTMIEQMGFVEVPPYIQWQSSSPLFFKEQFLFLKELITVGEIKKGVPVTFERGECETGEVFRRYVIGQLARQENPLRVYGYWSEDDGILGVTPEMLFELKGKYLLKSMALAGTRNREEKMRPPLLQDNKELNEHYIVIDDISHVLEPWGVVKSQPTEVLTLPFIEHLKTDIEVKLRQPHQFEDIVRALHPTPALGVSPREAIHKWLPQLSVGEDRKRFGAPFGLRNEDGTGICLVAIRNVQWEKRQIQLGAGSGIVRESDFDREWSEQKLKRETVKKMMGL